MIKKALKSKDVCLDIFLDKQAFDNVWHAGLKHKQNVLLPQPYSEVFDSYISDRFFSVKQDAVCSELKEIKAEVGHREAFWNPLYTC